MSWRETGFPDATRQDLSRRSRLYQKDQVRLWITGRKIRGPVKLLGTTITTDPEDCGAFKEERIWICEFMFEEDTRAIGEYDLGTELNEMETIAWASR